MSRRPAPISAPLRPWLARWRLSPDVARGPVAGARHPGLVVRAGGRRAYLKVSVEEEPGVEAEAQALAVLHAVVGSRVVLPRVLHHARGALVLEWLNGATLFQHRRRRRARPVDEAIGAALARVHHGAREALPERVVVGDVGRRLVWTSPELYASLGPAGLALLVRVQRDARATRRLVWLLETETRATAGYVHGDLRQPNVLVTRRGIAFLDWELSGLGDPARDLGMLLADDFSAYVSPRDRVERQSFAVLERHARGLVRGWERETAALGGARPRAFSTRVVAWLGEALLRRVFTLAHHDGALGAHGEYVLDAALALLRSPSAHARTLLGSAS